MYYDGSQYKDIYIYMKYLMINIDELQLMKLLWKLFIWKVCSYTLMLVNSTYWVISTPLPPLFHITDTLEGLLE